MATEHPCTDSCQQEAQPPSIKKKLREKFKQKLECTHCKKTCKLPRQWKCLHYFCSACLDELATSETFPRRCPDSNCEREICREDAGSGLAIDVPPDSFLELLIEVFEEFRREHKLDQDGAPLRCRGCKRQGTPISYCFECDNHFLCEGCRSQHENLTVFNGHHVESVQDLELESLAKQRTRFCKMAGHEGKKLTHYCAVCTRCICDACRDDEHADHADRIKPVDAAAEEARTAIKREVANAKTRARELEEKISTIDSLMNDIDRQCDQCKGKIKNAATKAGLESQEGELSDELDDQCKKAKRLLKDQRTLILRHKDQLCTTAKSTEAFVEKASNVDILDKKTTFVEGVTSLAQAEIDTRLASRPTFTFESYSIPEGSGSDSAPGSIGRIMTQLNRPSQSTAEGIGLSSAFDGLRSEFTVIRKDDDGGEVYISGEPPPSVSFSSPESPQKSMPLDVKVTDQANGKYTVTYFAKDPGSFTISITINGEHIYKSPFALQVLPREFKCEKVFGCYGTEEGHFKGPWGVAVNSADEIAVSDNHNHRVQIFDRDGRFQKAIGAYGTEEGKFDCPFGVAFDAEGNLLVADSNNHRVQKFDGAGQFVMQFGRKGGGDGEFNLPWSVSINCSNGNIIVSDKANNRIQIFSPEGNFLLKIRGTGDDLLSFSIACVVHNDHYFVSDTNNHCIKIFTTAGAFVSKFGSEGQGLGQLIKNQGLLVDKADNVVVCDSWNDRVQLFKLNADGLSVGSCRYFGSTGNQPGSLNDVSYVAMLSDGRFVVCDYRNHRVQIIA